MCILVVEFFMNRPILKLFATAFMLTVFLSAFLIAVVPYAKCDTKNVTSLVQIQYLRSDSKEDHIFLLPQQSVTYNATQESNGMRFESFNVQANSTNSSFLGRIRHRSLR